MTNLLKENIDTLPHVIKTEGFVKQLSEGLDEHSKQLVENNIRAIITDSLVSGSRPLNVALSLEIATKLVPAAKEAGLIIEVSELPVFRGITIPDPIIFNTGIQLEVLRTSEDLDSVVNTTLSSLIDYLKAIAEHNKVTVIYTLDFPTGYRNPTQPMVPTVMAAVRTINV